MRRRGARPGAKHKPLTAIELGTLQALAEGMTPTQIAAETRTKNARIIYRRLHQMRLKLCVFTSFELGFKVGKEGIIK